MCYKYYRLKIRAFYTLCKDNKKVILYMKKSDFF